MLSAVVAYLVLMNIISFLVMGLDKYKAKQNQWRIRESTLFLLVIMGGGLGGVLGMHIFRHKRKKLKFIVGFWGILLIWVIGLGYLFLGKT